MVLVNSRTAAFAAILKRAETPELFPVDQSGRPAHQTPGEDMTPKKRGAANLSVPNECKDTMKISSEQVMIEEK